MKSAGFYTIKYKRKSKDVLMVFKFKIFSISECYLLQIGSNIMLQHLIA